MEGKRERQRSCFNTQGKFTGKAQGFVTLLLFYSLALLFASVFCFQLPFFFNLPTTRTPATQAIISTTTCKSNLQNVCSATCFSFVFALPGWVRTLIWLVWASCCAWLSKQSDIGWALDQQVFVVVACFWVVGACVCVAACESPAFDWVYACITPPTLH